MMLGHEGWLMSPLHSGVSRNKNQIPVITFEGKTKFGQSIPHAMAVVKQHPQEIQRKWGREQSSMAEKPQLVQVLYCPICSLPAEYCEFGPDFEKCKPWLLKNATELYPHLLQEVNLKEAEKVSEQLQLVGISTEGGDGAASMTPLSGETSSKLEEVKRLPGGKVKKKEKQEIVIEKVVRNKRKCITIVKGLDLFGVKLSDASKKLGKKFATGASVVKGPTDKEQIDVQGDIVYDIVEFITETWPDVPETAIYFIEDGRKVAAA